jgi:hypothetical protein
MGPTTQQMNYFEYGAHFLLKVRVSDSYGLEIDLQEPDTRKDSETRKYFLKGLNSKFFDSTAPEGERSLSNPDINKHYLDIAERVMHSLREKEEYAQYIPSRLEKRL